MRVKRIGLVGETLLTSCTSSRLIHKLCFPYTVYTEVRTLVASGSRSSRQYVQYLMITLKCAECMYVCKQTPTRKGEVAESG